MVDVLTRLRPLLIGIVVLLLTAGIAFAGKPSAPPSGRAVAGEAAGKTVPVAAERDENEGDEQHDNREVQAVLVLPEADADQGGGENCATDPTGLTAEALAELKHGSAVCWAANQATPAGYDNHGQWVSEWARKNHGRTDRTHDAGSAAAPAGRANGHVGNGKANTP